MTREGAVTTRITSPDASGAGSAHFVIDVEISGPLADEEVRALRLRFPADGAVAGWEAEWYQDVGPLRTSGEEPPKDLLRSFVEFDNVASLRSVRTASARTELIILRSLSSYGFKLRSHVRSIDRPEKQGDEASDAIIETTRRLHAAGRQFGLRPSLDTIRIHAVRDGERIPIPEARAQELVDGYLSRGRMVVRAASRHDRGLAYRFTGSSEALLLVQTDRSGVGGHDSRYPRVVAQDRLKARASAITTTFEAPMKALEKRLQTALSEQHHKDPPNTIIAARRQAKVLSKALSDLLAVRRELSSLRAAFGDFHEEIDRSLEFLRFHGEDVGPPAGEARLIAGKPMVSESESTDLRLFYTYPAERAIKRASARFEEMESKLMAAIEVFSAAVELRDMESAWRLNIWIVILSVLSLVASIVSVLDYFQGP